MLDFVGGVTSDRSGSWRQADRLKTICKECGNTNALMDSAYQFNVREKHIFVEGSNPVAGERERI